MNRQVMPFSLADAFQAARFAQERKLMQQRQREGELRLQQMNESLAQMRQQSDATDIQRLLPEAVAAAQGTDIRPGDDRLLQQLQSNAAFGDARSQMAMQQAEQEKARFAAEKEQLGAASQRNEVLEQHAQMTVGFANAALDAVNAGDGARFERIHSSAQRAGIQLPANPTELLDLAQTAGAVRTEAPEMSADMRRFQEAQRNPAFAAELQRQEQQRLRERQAGATRVDIRNDVRGERSEATGTIKTQLQDTILAMRDADAEFGLIEEMKPPRFLGMKNRAYISAIRTAARTGSETALNAAAAITGVSPEQARQDIADAREFDGRLMTMFNSYRVAVTGAGGSEKEMDDIRRSYLNGELSAPEFMREIKVQRDRAMRRINTRNDALRDGFDVSAPPERQRRGGAAGQSVPAPSISAAQQRVRELQTAGTPIEEIQRVLRSEFPDVAKQFGGRR